MIGVTTDSGRVLVYAEVEIPNAPAGRWSPERCAKLIYLIETFIEGAALFDKFGLEGAETNVATNNVKRESL